MDYSSTYPWAKKDLLKETSIFITHLKIRDLGESRELCKKDQSLVKVVVCREGEPICSDESFDPNGPFYFIPMGIYLRLHYVMVQARNFIDCGSFLLFLWIQTIWSTIVGLFKWCSRAGSTPSHSILLQKLQRSVYKGLCLNRGSIFARWFPFVLGPHPRYQCSRCLEDLSSREWGICKYLRHANPFEKSTYRAPSRPTSIYPPLSPAS